MRLLKRRSLVALPLLAVACTTAPASDEAAARGSSALNAQDSINSVTYTLALSSVGVVNTWNPGNLPYVEYAAIGASTKTFGSNTNAQLVNTPIGCSLGTVPPGYDWGNPTPDVILTSCKSATTNAMYPANTPMVTALSQTVTLYHESDVVNFAVSLDNAGSTTISQIPGGAGSDLGLTGSALSTYGTIVGITTAIPTLGAGAVAGAVVSKIGTVLSFIGNLVGETVPVTSCGGGLIGNGPDPNGVPTAKPYDTLYYSYTAAQLEALTNSTGTGSITITTPVSVNWAQPLQGDIAGKCNSQHQLNVTITRVQNSGPAASPLAGSVAVARTATELDAIVDDMGHQGMANVQWSPSGGVTTSMATASIYAPSTYTPTATLSRQVLPANTALQITSAAGAPTPPTINLEGVLDSFWFDGAGVLRWTEWTPTSTWTSGATGGGGAPFSRLSATARTPNTMDAFWIDPKGNLLDYTTPSTVGAANLGFGTQTTIASGIAPKGAGVAAVSRFFNSEDVLFIGNNGGLYDATYTLGATPSWKVSLVGTSAGLAPPGAYVTAVARDANTVDAFFIGNSGAVYWARYVNQAVNGGLAGWPYPDPQPIPGAVGVPGGPLSAVSRSQGTIDLVYFASGNHLEYTQYDPNGAQNFLAPIQLATPSTVSPATDVSLVAPDSTHLGLVYRDPFWGVHAGSMTNGAWTFGTATLPTWKWRGWDSVSGGLVSDPALVSPNANEVVAAATGPDGTIWYASHSTASPSWTGWHSIGNNGNAFTDAPAIVAVNGLLEVFVRDPGTQTIMHREGVCESLTSCNAPSWSFTDWEELKYAASPTTFIAGTPTVAVSQPGNQINVFATGTDGAAHLISGTGYGQMGVVKVWEGTIGGAGRWVVLGSGEWTNLSGGVASEPAAVSWGPNRLDVFVRGTDNTLWHRYSGDNGATWSPANNNWESVGGSVVATPVALSRGAGSLDVVTSGISGQVQHLAWTGSAWVWDTVGNLPNGLMLGSRPVAILHGNSASVFSTWVLEVFAQDERGGLFDVTSTSLGAPASWSAWSAIEGCYRGNSAPAVVSADGVNVDLVINAQNGNSSIWHTSTAGSFTSQGLSAPPPQCAY